MELGEEKEKVDRKEITKRRKRMGREEKREEERKELRKRNKIRE